MGASPSSPGPSPKFVNEVDLSYRDMTLAEVKEVAVSLHRNRSISSLNLRGCNGVMDSKRSADLLLTALASHRGITRLNLSATSPSIDAFESLCAYLSRNSTLTELNLSANGLGRKHARLLATALGAPRMEEEVAVQRKQGEAGGAASPGDSGSGSGGTDWNRTLTCLDLSANGFTGDAFLALSRAFMRNWQLVSVNLSGNRIEFHDAVGGASAGRIERACLRNTVYGVINALTCFDFALQWNRHLTGIVASYAYSATQAVEDNWDFEPPAPEDWEDFYGY